ncbi:MAG: hypothetical protein C0598_05510 [Marinilabiliales bacterium]|nr:MAG: hypothetical protein C0598_05510 [Marinilabiliales bacterium]
MDITLYDVINTFLYLGSLQGFILTYFLFGIKKNNISNRLLGILTSLWAIILLFFALQSLGINTKFPHLLNTVSQLLFAWFPLLFLSVKYFVTSHSRFDRKDFLHFIPLLLSILILIPFYTEAGATKLIMVRNPEGYYSIASMINEEMLSVQGVVYSVIILMVLRNYEDRVIDYYSNINQSIIKWIKVGVILILFAWIIGIVGTIIERSRVDIGIDLFFFVYPIFVIIIYGISYVALRSGEVYKLKSDHISELVSIGYIKTKSGNNKLQNNTQSERKNTELSEDENEFEDKLNTRLVSFFENSKPYLNPDLSLQSLAHDLSVSRHQLSATINLKQQMNFFELVNSYRVKEVEELMKNDPEGKIKIYELAYDAGFNSKATFYRIFKQFTGQTPNDYRKAIISQS